MGLDRAAVRKGVGVAFAEARRRRRGRPLRAVEEGDGKGLLVREREPARDSAETREGRLSGLLETNTNLKPCVPTNGPRGFVI